MAEIAVTTIYPTTRFSHGAVIFAWLAITESDTLAVLEAPGHSDVSVQIEGTWGGGEIDLLGSNDGTNYQVLKDLDGADISPTADGAIVTVRENVRYYKPNVPTGTSVSLNVWLLAKAVR